MFLIVYVSNVLLELTSLYVINLNLDSYIKETDSTKDSDIETDIDLFEHMRLKK